MNTVEPRDRALSTNEAPLQRLPTSKPEPPTRSRPLSDSFDFHAHADRSGCGEQVQPVTIEGRLNGLNASSSAAWSHPVIGQPEGKPYSTRIMKLFSNSKKGPFPAPSGAAETPGGANGGPQAWPGLSGLAVVDSFKKLRTSVLQGIQSRASGNSEGDLCSSAQDEANLNFTDGHGSCNGNFSDLGSAATSQCESDLEDDDDDGEVDGENGEGESFARNTRLSRSIRRAYGPGRISLLDQENGTAVGLGRPKPEQKLSSQQEAAGEEDTDAGVATTGLTVLGRLSKSAENLHIFKAPFRRRPLQPSVSVDGPPGVRPPLIQRTVSASSVEVRGRKRSPVKAKGPMLKLVGSVTDLAVRRRRSPSPSPATPSSPAPPASPAVMSPLSRLHDDYSRRLPCLAGAERQRRPSPIRARALSAGHAPAGHLQCDEGTPQQQQRQHQVLISCSAKGPPDAEGLPPPDNAALKSSAPSSATSDSLTEATASPGGCVCPGPDSDSEKQEVTSSPPVKEALLLAEDVPPLAASSPPLSPTSPSESPTSPPDATPSPPSSTESSALRPRRRGARPRPRPISDYGQLLSRKQSIPEEAAQQRAAAERTRSGDIACDNGESEVNGCTNGDADSRKLRPVSVIGGVDLLTSNVAEKDDRLPSPLSRPPIPSHQVPPYRAVSARFRPTSLSQSTPIGLDRVGHRKLHRVLSDGMSECSATLDDSVSEEEEDGSFDELADGTPYLQPGVELSVLNEWIISGRAVYAEALWDHVTMEEQELAFKAGDVIRILDASHKDWWWGQGPDRDAWFPSTFVRVRVNQEDSSAESVESVADQEEDATSREAHSTKHKEQMRTNVVQEILKTERIYIKHLKDICDGYIRQCHKHPHMFTELQLQTIFSNIEDIYKFQKQFLRDLEKNYNKDQPHLSEIGSCFLQHGEGFSIYSEYCNTHPAACAELHRLMKNSKYKHFFESCRLLQKMIDISIAGFLLTPVQKICKYPLQLGELLKYTPKDHSDHGGVSDAYNAMKNVASLINERKRRLESIDTIAHWQVAILHWEGSNVLERSSELIHSGELTRIVRQGKMQQRSFFLFDHQLVFCKKDVLRRDLLHYRGRLDMDQTQVLDVADGRDQDLGVTLRNALRLRNAFTLEFMCVLCCRKAEDKQRWLEAFAKERNRVKEDQEMGMEISEEQRKLAIINARRAKQGKSKSASYSGGVSQHQQSLHPLHQRHVTIPTSVPQQQVFALAEPPKRKPYDVLYTFTRNAFFRK